MKKKQKVNRKYNFPDADLYQMCMDAIRLAKRDLNIADLLNKSRGDLAYTLVDVDGDLPVDLLDELSGINGVLSVRAIEH